MKWGLQGLAISLLCAFATGLTLTSDLFGVLELLGIAALITCIVLPMPREESPVLARLKAILFFGGFGLVFVSTVLTHAASFNAWATYIVVISLYTTLGGASLGLSGTFNRFQLGLILYSVSSLGIGIGYIGQFYLL